MYQIGDIVQPRLGGPKLKIVEVHGDQVVGVAANEENAEKITLKAADVTPYTEEGDFGVC